MGLPHLASGGDALGHQGPGRPGNETVGSHSIEGKRISPYSTIALDQGWLSLLYRDHQFSYHRMAEKILKQGKDPKKSRKLDLIKEMEKNALNDASKARKENRLR